MEFAEKNRFIVKHTDPAFADRDMSLLLSKNPSAPVLRKQVNKFNVRKIDGEYLLTLLNMGVSPDEILDNRKIKPENEGKESSDLTPEVENENTDPNANENSGNGSQTEGKSGQNENKTPHKVQKEQEFPNIKWDNTDDENVQLAILVYNDRVNCYKKAAKLQPELEQKPELAAQYQEIMIRHKIADNELISFNKSGKWVGEHSLCSRLLNKKRLERMTLPEVNKELTSAKQNVSRYSSMLKNKKYKDEADRKRIEALVEKHSSKKAEIESYLEKVNDNKKS
jgi:hypothetical protein